MPILGERISHLGVLEKDYYQQRHYGFPDKGKASARRRSFVADSRAFVHEFVTSLDERGSAGTARQRSN